MTVTINGDTGITSPGLDNTANTTLGDASGDTVTINAATVSTPNGLNFDSNTLVIDAANNRVGVGIASPTSVLHISSASQPYLKILYAATREYALTVTGSSTTDGLAIRDESGSLEIARFTRSGNLLVGWTTAPTASASVIANGIQSTNTSGGGGYLMLATSGGGQQFYTHTGVVGSESYSERMRIDSSGQVGIGTSSPSTTLEVAGAFSGAGGLTLTQNNGNGNGGRGPSLDFKISQSEDGSVLVTGGRIATLKDNGSAASGAAAMIFYTSTSTPTLTEAMRIDSSGNLLVGATSDSTSTLATGILSKSAGGTNFIAQNTNGSATAFRFYTSTSTLAGAINTSGSTTTYATSSDYRLKEVSGALSGYKERLLALQPKQGSWKTDGAQFRGFLAHEFAISYPSSVSGQKDAVDANGNPEYQSMQAGSSEVIADLVAMIQEQQAIIESLKSRLDAAGL